jgi:hypothetical protein
VGRVVSDDLSLLGGASFCQIIFLFVFARFHS